MRFEFSPIGILRTPFDDKFGIPRQAGLAAAARGRLELLPPYDREEAFGGLEGFSHIWLLCVFHAECLDAGWRPTVRPPRLGGRARVGVFASRAPYRPNPIGLSAVAHDGLERDRRGLALRVRGVDLLDGTPVLDIKPYVPYADAIGAARGGFAVAPRAPRWPVRFGAAASGALRAIDPDGRRELRPLIEQVIAADPRPGYLERYPARCHFALRLAGLEVRWELRAGEALVTAVDPFATIDAGVR